MNPLFELVQFSIGTRDDFPSAPDSFEAWKALLLQVAEHSLVGVTFPAVEKLSSIGDVPLEIYYPWELAVKKITRKNQEQRNAIVELHKFFRDNGFRNCILKGQSMSALYPDPSLRQSGDIDIWLEGDRQQVLAFLNKHFKVIDTRYIHSEMKTAEGLNLEVHYTPSWMNAPWSNRRLQRWFKACNDEQFSNYDASLGFCVPTLAFDAVFILIHIYRHVLEEGIGLRQLLDYYQLLIHLTDADRRKALDDLRHLKLLRFTQAIMYVMVEGFRLDEKYLLCEPDSRLGAYLMDSILTSGNFGHSDPRNENSRKESLVVHGWHKFMRNLRFGSFSLSESLCMPMFATWQYFWRRKHGYLYKGR